MKNKKRIKILEEQVRILIKCSGNVSKSKSELTELPEKWCLIYGEKEAPIIKKYLKWENNSIFSYNFLNGGNSIKPFVSTEKYNECTEITFDQFKKWVLKEDDSKNIEIEGIKHLSIREVQVKVTSQEEANECAEIAKACGEIIGDIRITDFFSYFRKDGVSDEFQSLDKSIYLKVISIQEYRERFGKSTEIDWSKSGQLVCEKDDELLVLFTSGHHEKDTFQATTLIPRHFEPGIKDYKGEHWLRWSKENFKLCTEPITLKNE